MIQIKVLFLATELYEPAGGLYRYTTNLLNAWRKALEEGRTDLEPLVISVKNPSQPPEDLKAVERFSDFTEANKEVEVYEAEREGEKCYFLEGDVPDMERFHWELWNRYGIDSTKSSHGLEWYNTTLSPFWYWAPRFAEFLRDKKGIGFKAVDAQDWLAFPGGFLSSERLNLPLVCRIHSGEYGRSLGNPDFSDAPIQIETASLAFADYIQGVSISETVFQINHLMPLKRELDEELKKRRSGSWYRYQNYRNEKIKSFLLYESESKMTLLKDIIGGMPNGIYLDEWEKVDERDINEGRERMEQFLPEKDKFIFFIGRTSYRKGLDFLLQTFSEKKEVYKDVGLLVASSMDKDTYREYEQRLESLGISEDVKILNKWLGNKEKMELMCASDVIALPSVYEPFGIVALEGLAADYAAKRNGTTGPVTVVGNTGGMDEIITSGVTGFEVPIHNFKIETDMLHSALQKALDEENKEKITKAGAKRVKDKHFRWSYIFNKVLEVYDLAEENWKERLRYTR
ncbi:MAG: glycosyltransferase family 4 protein [Candidatus Aenigmatarchaeota archaeon]